MTSTSPEPTPSSQAAPRKKWKARTKLMITGVIAAPFLAFGLYVWASFAWSYSTGERAGYIQKFSRKGWICKTWEGELAMVSLPGASPEKFLFTVRDEQVADHLNRTMGQRVALSYEQHKGLPTSCFGDTEYFVYSVRPL